MPSGVSADDLNIPFADWAVTVVHTPRVITHDNVSGDETFTNSTTASVSAILLRRTARWMFDKAGEIEGGDAYILTKAANSFSKDDLFTYDGKVYQVNDVIKRTLPDGTVFYYYGNLFIRGDA